LQFQIDLDKTTAEFTEGVLTLTMPKTEESKQKPFQLKLNKNIR